MENQEQPQTISARLAPPSYAEAMGLAAAPKYEQPVIRTGQQSQSQPLQVPPYPVQSPLPGCPYQNNYYLNGDSPPPYSTAYTPHTSRQPPTVECIVVTEEVQDPRRKPNQSCCSRRIIIFVTFTFLTLYLARLIISVVRVA